jgi:hypothetical protein
MRFAKIFRFGTKRVDVGVDLGSLLNTNYVTTYENDYQFSAATQRRAGRGATPQPSARHGSSAGI